MDKIFTIRAVYSIFILLFISTATALGQISISSVDILALRGTSNKLEIDTTQSITVNVGSEGADRMWDFTSVNIEAGTATFGYENPVGSPYADSFPGANMVQMSAFGSGDDSAHVFTYFNVIPASMKELGSVVYVPSLDSVLQFSEYESITPLPITYLSSWMTADIDSNDFGEDIININEVVSNNTVDAWGMVKIPAGDFSCLRIREYRQHITTTKVGPMVVFSDTLNWINYLWVAKNQFLVASIESQEGETDPNFTNAEGFSRLKDNSSPNAIEPEIVQNLPVEYILEQNYPNPFNPQTTIRYQLAEPDLVTLEIYDASGRKIRTMFTEKQSPGSHQVVWNGYSDAGEPVASGTYLYRLKAGGKVLSNKMTLIR